MPELERIRFVTHQGQRVLLIDMTGCSAAEVAALSDRVPSFVTREPLGSVLAVGDFTGAEFSRESVERIKVAAALDQPYIKRAAWVLTRNMPKALYDSILSFSARQIPIFPTREQALEYLVSGA